MTNNKENIKLESIKLEGGKYEIVIEYKNNKMNFEALKYGEKWRDLTGDNLALAMFFRIQDLERQLLNLVIKK